jgi:hypothetical protein
MEHHFMPTPRYGSELESLPSYYTEGASNGDSSFYFARRSPPSGHNHTS